MENLNKKTESVLIQMLQSKPIDLPSNATPSRVCSKRVNPLNEALSDEDDVMILDDEPRRWSKKRRLLGKVEKKCLSSGEDDSGGSSSSSSSGSPSDGECCEYPNDSGCDDDDESDSKEGSGDKIQELCWQLEENFKENNVSCLRQIHANPRRLSNFERKIAQICRFISERDGETKSSSVNH
jgi:hypothetical protein